MKKTVLSLTGIMLLSGCATLATGSKQTINMATSSGKQAEATITSANGTFPVILPQAVTVEKSSENLIINITESDCIAPTTTMVVPYQQPWFWGNIIFGGLFGSTTDSASGAAWEYDDNLMVNINLKDVCR